MTEPEGMMKIHVEVWIASRVLGADGQTFSKDALLAFIGEKLGDRRSGVSTHISSYAVASVKANPGKYRYLTVLGRGLYRVYRVGDPTHPSKVDAPLQPDRDDLPEDYRYLFEDTATIKGTPSPESAAPSGQRQVPSTELITEEDVEKLVLERLADAFNGPGGQMRTRILLGGKEFIVERQGKVSYRVGNTRIAHKNDLLISDMEGKPRVGIEVVFRSAVTDHFKTRSYDVTHMKQEVPDLKGLLVYVKSNTGINPELAREISYAFDFFFSIREAQAGDVEAWKPFLRTIAKWLEG
jgi:hypothetical protein